MSNISKKRYTITSALPYANGPLHIGHLAGAYIPGDIFVRYLRLNDKDVVYVCGSDEHGAAITIRAKKEGITPQEIIDKYNTQIKESFEEFGISFDIYHRTSQPIHHALSQEFFLNLYEKGEFIEKFSEQYYDEDFNQFLADRYIVGTCPNCKSEGAYGDQCEKCGTSLSPTDLINPISTLSGKTPVLRKTKHWYLPLDKYQPWLEKWLIEGKKDVLKSNVFGQCQSWLKSGLQPRSMTRDLDWGVDVPLKEAAGKKLYVWLDAPIGYISATKQWAIDNGKNWEDYWKKQENPEDDSCLIHFIGKDNIVFHCIIFPAILHAHGEYILPDNVPANEFLNLEGDKLSTSRNHAVWLHEYLEEFPGKQDELRYVLTSILPETSDSEFTWKDFQARVNNELVAIFGNFVNRVMVLSHKYFDGKVLSGSPLNEVDQNVFAELAKFPDAITGSIQQYRFREALAQFMNVARLGNKYLADEEPWKVIKTDEERVKTVLNVATQIVANLAVLAQPFLPKTATKLFEMLDFSQVNWADAGRADLIADGHQLSEVQLLFEKITDEQVEFQLNKLAEAKIANAAANVKTEPAKANIAFEDFTKLDIRVGTILEAEKVAKTKKLLKIKIDTGIDQRTVVSGIAEFFAPEDIIGKQVSILVNLEPRDIKGITSQGMILMAEDADGRLDFVNPTTAIKPGSTIR
ncbi:methionine--tRNA ligase [Sphingobacterium faecium]|uniref:methionine--tRNA ligase n=1 Tax=Sphingobacterium faecium TaxID=34087 RepID=UPI00097EFE82|nr:methionine--tRNA ligase [Sphingobacterium faecium]WGQ16731.1 methionine--tRNA ligase [Sphingobacterium faecium]SJN33200.1 Methionyl-tRNA synthetase [Sphingobacterium faecium PCAi_F2.5]HCU44375.1 methionine--tRNA ligase [Sphingobacterium sp.]